MDMKAASVPKNPSGGKGLLLNVVFAM